MGLTERPWLTLLAFSIITPTLLLTARIYFDLLRRPSAPRTRSSIISLAFAILAHVTLLIGASMSFYRNSHRGSIPMLPATSHFPEHAEGLGFPLIEATIIHSYIIPTGLWLCKASFVAMYFSLSHHVSRKLRHLLNFAVIYLVVSYLLLVLTHALWCGSWFKTWTSTPSAACTPFTTTVPIALYAFANISSFALIILTPLLMLRQAGGAKRPRERYAVAFLVFLGVATVATTATCCGLHITYRKRLLSWFAYVQLAELLACIELATAVCAVSLPSLRAVLYRKGEEKRRKSEAGTARGKWMSGSSSMGTPRSGGGGGSTWEDWRAADEEEREIREGFDDDDDDYDYNEPTAGEVGEELGKWKGDHEIGNEQWDVPRSPREVVVVAADGEQLGRWNGGIDQKRENERRWDAYDDTLRTPGEEEDATSPVLHTPI